MSLTSQDAKAGSRLRQGTHDRLDGLGLAAALPQQHGALLTHLGTSHKAPDKADPEKLRQGRLLQALSAAGPEMWTLTLLPLPTLAYKHVWGRGEAAARDFVKGGSFS